MIMTVFDKHLIECMSRMFPGGDAGAVTERLIRMGVVSATRCKALAIRDYVEKAVKEGSAKVNAMYRAADHFRCSYEYVRKCIYYYKDVGADRG